MCFGASSSISTMVITFLLACIILSGCAAREAPFAVQGAAPGDAFSDAQAPVAAPDQIYRETGIAAWYGREFHGRKTASGEIFDMNLPSAAHRTLPLGTLIRVTNLDNFKSIKLKVIDRGPFVKGRVLDLSYGAAKDLEFAAQGIARVRIEAVDAVRNNGQFTVQAAVFSEQESARMLKERLNKRFEVVTITPYEANVAVLYRVRVGAYATEERAEQVAAKLTLEGLEPIVVRKD